MERERLRPAPLLPLPPEAEAMVSAPTPIKFMSQIRASTWRRGPALEALALAAAASARRFAAPIAQAA